MTGIYRMTGWFLATGLLSMHAQPARKGSVEILDQFSESVQALAARVAPSVVQISVSRYAPREQGDTGRTGLVLGREQAIGSGVIIDPDGYIVTNAHVVSNALRIRVTRMAQSPIKAAKPDQTISDALALALAPPVEATLVGVYKELDLALIKIADTGLPALKFADYRKLRQGQVVFAFGSRQGLGNSMSMGVVSSVARQPEPDSPFVFIQTDAPINPGDSGGPLVNTAGEIVGLDTFILSQSGGSEGIGFAIPSALIELASGELRKYGHMHQQMIGVGVQTITPLMSSALGLPRDAGVLISDVAPGGQAEQAGVKLNDIVTAVDGRRIENVPMFTTAMLSHPGGRKVQLDLQRGTQELTIEVPTTEESHDADRLSDRIDPDKNRVRQLGIIGLAVDKEIEGILPGLRGPYGVIVAALSASAAASATGLQVGDVIHEVNGTAVSSVEALRTIMEKFKRGDAVALFIERDSKLQYLAFEIE
ncbi:MAG TPA: trypsin-like peptidase domain-containing protein [Bryobacteraceae bacterium]|nr:trypsin-like peptidase domain-containing protein [Bryobacteraceae bacterium]